MAAVLGLEGYCRARVPRRLHELIELRASQLNRCDHCIALHTKALRKAGESEARIAALADEVPGDLFDARERAALALTDSVTRLGPEGVEDEVWNGAAAHFTDSELGDLVLSIATINVWNRLAIATRLDA